MEGRGRGRGRGEGGRGKGDGGEGEVEGRGRGRGRGEGREGGRRRGGGLDFLAKELIGTKEVGGFYIVCSMYHWNNNYA